MDDEAFEKAAGRVSSGQLGVVPQSTQLKLYGLFTVARKGKAPSQGPSQFLDPRGYAKWTAWAAESHLTSDEAKAEYVEFVHSIEERDDLGEDLADDETTGFAVGASMKGFEETNGTILPNDGSGDGTANPAEQTLGLGHWASLNDHKSVKFCLEKQKLNPDECDADGLTPLMRAADRDATDAMQLLLEAGASTDPVDEDGCTALHYAAICDHTGAATMLARYGADPNALNNDGESALELASDVLRTAIEKARREHIDGNVSAPVSSTAGWTVQVSRVSALVVVSVIVALAAIGIATLVGRNSVPYADTNEGGAR